MTYNANVTLPFPLKNAAAAFAAAISISFVSVAPAAWAQTPPAPAAVPSLVQKTLPSGLRLLIAARSGAKLVALALSVRVGTGQETEQNSGAAHFIEHMVFKGTLAQKPGEVDAQMESLGGELTARTSRDQTLYTVTVPQANWQKALPVLSDLVSKPAFRDGDMEAERRVILREQAAALTEPVRTGFGQLAGEAYPVQSAYRFPLMGKNDSFARLTARDLRDFWQAWYTPPHFSLVVVGDVSPADVELAANTFFSPTAVPLPAAPVPPPALSSAAPFAAPVDAIARAVTLPPAQQPQRELTTVFMGFFVPLRSDDADENMQKAQAALHVLARWLVRGGGGAGRLEQTLVIGPAHQEAQDANADFVPGNQGGLLFVSATFAPDEAARAETHLANALRRLREDDVLEGEVESAKQAVLGEMRFQNETVEEMAKALAQSDALHPALMSDPYASLIGQIGVKDVRNALRLYLTDSRYTVAFVGPTPAAKIAGDEVVKP